MVSSRNFHSVELKTSLDAATYFQEMFRLGRLAVIRDMNEYVAVCTFFLCNTIEDAVKFYKKGMWKILPDKPQGTLAYIDKLVANDWNGTTRRMIQQAILMQNPQVQAAVWLRPGKTKDRLCIYLRKEELENVAKV